MKEFYITPANNSGFETAVTMAVKYYCPILVANGKVAKAMRKFIDEYGYVDSVGDEIEVIDAHKAKFPFNRSVVLYQPDEVFEVCFKRKFIDEYGYVDSVGDEIEVIDAHKAKFPFNRSVVLYQPDEVFEVCFKANVVGSVMTYDEVNEDENDSM